MSSLQSTRGLPVANHRFKLATGNRAVHALVPMDSTEVPISAQLPMPPANAPGCRPHHAHQAHREADHKVHTRYRVPLYQKMRWRVSAQ